MLKYLLKFMPRPRLMPRICGYAQARAVTVGHGAAQWLTRVRIVVTALGCSIMTMTVPPALAAADDDGAESSTPEPAFIDLRQAGSVTGGDAARGKEKAGICIACHGDSGISLVPIYPNLRGQTVEYLYWALRDYKRESRSATPMAPFMAPLNDQDLRDLAAYYAQIGTVPVSASTAAAPNAQTSALMPRGEQLYLHGDAQRGIPACQGCHGADGRGHPLVTGSASSPAPTFYRTYPALRGQQGNYLAAKLTEYQEAKLGDSTNDFIMTGVARNLDQESIQALAAWLSAQTVD